MTAILMANCKFCKSNNIETLHKTFSLCKDCNCIYNQNFSSRKKSFIDNNYELKSSSIIHDTVKMRFWDIISQQYIAYLKSKTDMKFNNAIDIGALYGHLVKRLNSKKGLLTLNIFAFRGNNCPVLPDNTDIFL